jgi:hypothetical protein
MNATFQADSRRLMLCFRFPSGAITMMRPNASVEKVYLDPKPVGFRKSIDGLAASVKLDIKVVVFDLMRSMNPTYCKMGPRQTTDSSGSRCVVRA